MVLLPWFINEREQEKKLTTILHKMICCFSTLEIKTIACQHSMEDDLTSLGNSSYVKVFFTPLPPNIQISTDQSFTSDTYHS